MSEIELDERGGWSSASNAQADALCPGRHLAQSQIPETGNGKRDPDRDSGDRLHNALLKRDPTGLPIDEQERYDSAILLEDRLVAEFFGAHSDAARKNCVRETRFWAQVEVPPGSGRWLKHSGKPDVVYRHGTRALIIEYKGLYGDVPPAPVNLQLRDQAVLVKGHYVLINEVGVAIIQPAVQSSVEPICSYELTHLNSSADAMFNRVVSSNDTQSPRVAGEVQCRHCRAKLNCPEYNRFAGTLVPGMMSLLDVTPSDWSPEQRAEFLNKRALAQKWLDDCYDAIKGIVEKDPDGAPGWRLRPGAKRETIANPQVAYERFTALGGQLEQFMPCISVGKKRLKEQVQLVTHARGKALEGAMAKVLDGITVTSQASGSLVKADQDLVEGGSND